MTLLAFWLWPAWIWPWLAGSAAVAVEFSFRLNPAVPYSRQWLALLLALPINYGIYRIVIAAPSLLAGFILFSTVTLGLRITATVILLREPVDTRTWIALSLLVAAKVIMR